MRRRFLLTLLCGSALYTVPATAQVQSNFWLGGGVRIGDSTTTCDAAIEGSIRYNDTTNVHQFCNGSAWANINAGAVLSGLAAAGADNTIANAAWNQVWNWQLTAAETGFTFGESAASTGGSSNQYVLSAATLASSTAIPFYIKNLGAGRSFQVDDVASDTSPFLIDASGNVGIGNTAPAAKLDVTGEVKVGVSTGLACSGTTEGSLRYDSTDHEFEFCNGSAWLPVLLALSQPYLTLTPTTATMNITGPGTPAYSSYTTFTVENLGTIDSGTIAFTLTDTTYFEFGTNTCTGGASVLSQSETCTIQVRAKAAIDTTYSGQLRVTVNNQPTANLSGTSTATCGVAGDSYGGGKLVKCEAGYALVATPGGCTDSTTPTCAGGVDNITKTFSSENVWRGAGSATDGPANTTTLVAYHASPPTYNAAKYCADMTYGGYSDWYLPAMNETCAMHAVSSAIGGYPTGGSVSYFSSTEVAVGAPHVAETCVKNIDTGVITSSVDLNKTGATVVRCARRQ